MTTKTEKSAKAKSPCQCFAVHAYDITKGDTPESLQENDDPNEVVAHVYGTCGEMTSRTFAPGHDAKLKGVLLRAARAGEEYAYVDGGFLVYADPQLELAKREWSHLLVELTPRKPRTKVAKQTKRLSDAADALEAATPAPPGFHPIQV